MKNVYDYNASIDFYSENGFEIQALKSPGFSLEAQHRRTILTPHS